MTRLDGVCRNIPHLPRKADVTVTRTGSARGQGGLEGLYSGVAAPPRYGVPRRVAEALGAHRHAGRARGEEIGGVTARSDASHADHGDSRPPARPKPPARAPPLAPPGPRRRRCAPPSHGRAVRGSSAMPLRVLTSETASAPASSAARATRGGLGRVGRELHDQRLVGERPHRAPRRARSRRGRRPSRGRSRRSGRTRSARRAPPRRARRRARRAWRARRG